MPMDDWVFNLGIHMGVLSSIVLLLMMCHDLLMGNCKIVVTVSVAEYFIKIRYL
jgi:hypothetical protein